jgi:hypothetical protein
MPEDGTRKLCTAEKMQSGGVGSRKRTGQNGRDREQAFGVVKKASILPVVTFKSKS